MRISDVLLARCPSCHRGKMFSGVLRIRPRCAVCGCDFHPEPGYYLGAMMVSYLVTAMLTVPVFIILKFSDAELPVLLGVPLLEYVFLCPLLMRYSRVLWRHVEFSMTTRLDQR
ncbi:MAG: DUF983 domain-containing protein [Bdellovibrionota bacterium]